MLSHILIVMSLLTSVSVLAAGDAKLGATKSQSCGACHTASGNSVNPEWPKIAGQHPSYLVKQLMAFKQGASGPRNNALMLGFAANLSKQDMEDLAAYFASQEMSKGKVPQKFYELGTKIYQGGNLATNLPACKACHQQNGAGSEIAGIPRLAGQHAAYTIMQLKNYRDKTRSTDPNSMMRQIAAKMSDSEIEAVANYVAGLR